MHTDSSASRTYFASRSASECTTTVLMSISRHARWTRSAISPRFAIRILSKSLPLRAAGLAAMPRSADDEQGLAEFHRLTVFGQDRLDHASLVRLDLVHELHGFDDAQGLAFLDAIADVDERRRAGRGRAIERADHRALHDVAFLGRRLRAGGGGARQRGRL